MDANNNAAVPATVIIKPPKYLTFLSMLYMAIMLSVAVYSNKIVIVANHITMAGTIIIPIWFALADVIAEIYGYKAAKKIIWYAFFCQFIFMIISTFLLKVPSPSFWHGAYAYEYVLGALPRLSIVSFFAYIISAILNIYLLTRWQMLIQGKYFWLRSLGSSTIGEFFFTVMAVTAIQYNKLPFADIYKIIATSYSIKVISSIMYAYPATLLVFFLKRSEGLSDNYYNFNPFNNS